MRIAMNRLWMMLRPSWMPLELRAAETARRLAALREADVVPQREVIVDALETLWRKS